MGLDTTHDCWHGSYSAFHYWREALHIYASPDPLLSLEQAWDAGVYEDQSKPINVLMFHSDCDGEIPAELCAPLADELQKIADAMPDKGSALDMVKPTTLQFIAGLRKAAELGQPVEFH
jgi:hypothetical protein